MDVRREELASRFAEASIRVKAMEKEAMKCAAEWNAREIRDRLMDAIRQGAGEDHGKI